MKVAITGKGGVGKTTFASTLCRLYAEEGRTVLAADVDPDANLGLALGLTEEEVNSIVPVSKMKELARERTAANESHLVAQLLDVQLDGVLGLHPVLDAVLALEEVGHFLRALGVGVHAQVGVDAGGHDVVADGHGLLAEESL